MRDPGGVMQMCHSIRSVEQRLAALRRGPVLAMCLLLPLQPACGASTDGSAPTGGGIAPGGSVTLASLTPAERAGFEVWKKRVVKGCAWEEAFPGLARDYPPLDGSTSYEITALVDLTALSEANQGTPMIQGAHGEIVLLGEPAYDQSVEVNERRHAGVVNGRGGSFAVASNREDSECVVVLGGEEVFRARMVKQVPVVIFADDESRNVAGKDLDLEDAVNLNDSFGFLDTTPLLHQPLAALAPVPRAQNVLATRFGVALADAQSLFPLGTQSWPVAVKPLDREDEWTFAPGGVLYGSRSAIERFREAAALHFAFLFTPPLSGISTMDESLADKLLALSVEVTIDDGGKNARATAIALGDTFVRNAPRETLECFKGRHRAAQSFAPADAVVRFDPVFDGCDALTMDGYASLAADEESRALIASRTLARTPGAYAGSGCRNRPWCNFDYLGWDAALERIAVTSLKTGMDLTMLDPSTDEAKAPYLDRLSATIRRLTAYEGAVAASARDALREPIVTMVLAWALHRQALPGGTDEDAVTAALTNAGDRYPVSVARMLADMASSSTVTLLDAGQRAANCGKAFTVDHATKVAGTIDRVRAKLRSGSTFADGLRDEVLQRCPDPDELGRIDGAVDAASTFEEQDEALGDGVLFESHLERLVTHALEERWSDDTFRGLPDVVAFATLTHVYCDYEAVSDRALCVDPDLASLSAVPGKKLAPEFDGRYAALARELVANWKRWFGGDGLSAFSTQRALSEAFFGDSGLLVGCSDNAAFGRYRGELVRLLNQLVPYGDFDREYELAKQIEQLVNRSACEGI